MKNVIKIASFHKQTLSHDVASRSFQNIATEKEREGESNKI